MIVILPTSKLNDFETSRIPFPFIFQLVPLSSTDNTNKPEKEDNNQTNTTNNTNDEENLKRQTHCGVLDFTAPDEIAYLPHHVRQTNSFFVFLHQQINSCSKTRRLFGVCR